MPLPHALHTQVLSVADTCSNGSQSPVQLKTGPVFVVCHYQHEVDFINMDHFTFGQKCPTLNVQKLTRLTHSPLPLNVQLT